MFGFSRGTIFFTLLLTLFLPAVAGAQDPANQLAGHPSPMTRERQLLADAVRILLPLRQARSLPRDHKMNAGLNGLALPAFSQAIPLEPAY